MTEKTFSRPNYLMVDADTFFAAMLSASCWSNLGTEVTEMGFLRHAGTAAMVEIPVIIYA